MLEKLIGTNFDIFILCFLGQFSFMIFSFDLILKFFKVEGHRIKESIKIICFSAFSFFLFYYFFKLIFIAAGLSLRIFPIMASSFISFFVFKIIFQNKYQFFGRGRDILIMFLVFLFTNAASLLLIFYILKSFKLI